MPVQIRALLLEDRPADAELVIYELRRAGFDPEWQRVDTEADYLTGLHPDLDIILADFTLPQFDAKRALSLLREQEMDIPFIVISGMISEELAVECMKQGAADYLLKDRLSRLGQAVTRALEQRQLREAERQSAQALRESEEQLRQSQRLEAVGRLAGGIAHDFNNMLTVITGYSDILMMRLGEGNPLSEYVQEITKAGERSASLTRQLLAFSRKQVLQPKVLDINSVMTDMGKMFERLIGEDIELRIMLTPEVGRINADPGQIEQVIMNLVINARDAMPQGGKLTIETANVDLDRTYANLHGAVQPGQYVMLAVSDTGSGMDAETQERIFEPFFTTKELGKGTGLGLATVYGIVKQSNGNIWVYSELGIGTTFKIYLPQVELEAEALQGTSEPGESVQGSETILLVEDEEIVRKMIRNILEADGYQVLEATNGKDALLICKSYEQRIHLLITDVVMPQMNGRDLANTLEPLYPEMRVLYMSGYTDDAIVHHGVLDTGTLFLQKPFTPKILSRKVREALSSHVGSR